MRGFGTLRSLWTPALRTFTGHAPSVHITGGRKTLINARGLAGVVAVNAMYHIST